MPGGLSLSPGVGWQGVGGPQARRRSCLRPEPAMAECLRGAEAVHISIIIRRLLRGAGVVRGAARPGAAGAKQAKPAFAARRAAGLRPGSLRLAETPRHHRKPDGPAKGSAGGYANGEKEKAAGSPLPYRNFFPSAGLSRPGNG